MPLTHEQFDGLLTQLHEAARSIGAYKFYATRPMGDEDTRSAAIEHLGNALEVTHEILEELLYAMAEPPVESEGCAEAEQEPPQTHEHQFVLRIPSVSAFDDDIEEALIAAGIDDGTMSWREGMFRGRFTRAALTRDDAIRQVIEDMRRAGIEAALEEER